MLFFKIQTKSLFDIKIVFKFVDINYFIHKNNFGYRLVTEIENEIFFLTHYQNTTNLVNINFGYGWFMVTHQ